MIGAREPAYFPSDHWSTPLTHEPSTNCRSHTDCHDSVLAHSVVSHVPDGNNLLPTADLSDFSGNFHTVPSNGLKDSGKRPLDGLCSGFFETDIDDSLSTLPVSLCKDSGTWNGTACEPDVSAFKSLDNAVHLVTSPLQHCHITSLSDHSSSSSDVYV